MEGESCSRPHCPPQRKISCQVSHSVSLWFFHSFLSLMKLHMHMYRTVPPSSAKRVEELCLRFQRSSIRRRICKRERRGGQGRVGRSIVVDLFNYGRLVCLRVCRKEAVTLPENQETDVGDIEHSLHFSSTTATATMGFQQTAYFAMVNETRHLYLCMIGSSSSAFMKSHQGQLCHFEEFE